MKERNNTKGITLIALVITIIVLLILAGVSIAMLTGQNGILTQAQNSKTVTENKSAEEKVKLAVMAARTRSETAALELDKLKEEIANQGGTATNNEFPVNVTMDGESFKVTNTGVVTAAGSSTTNPNPPASTDTLKASDIAGKTDKTKIYGATVTGYTLPSGTTTDVKWKIFYADNSNIYLIADNYVERANLPNSTNGTTATANKPNDGSTSCARAAYFSNILEDYKDGSSRITENRLKALNNDYFNTKGYTSTNSNMKSVAYMMDTTAWNSKFRDTSKAEYVVGGPTVELLFKSYNEKYKTAYESQASSATGYQIRKTSSDDWSNSIGSMLTTSDQLYVITKTSDAYAYWLASPSADRPNCVMNVYCNGDVSYDNYSNFSGNGFRPLVCLKSDVTLEKVSDTEYAIQ